ACRLLFGVSMALALKRRRQATLLQKLALFLIAFHVARCASNEENGILLIKEHGNGIENIAG
ncbi:MAG: hypothetical protein NTX50_29285, partial [Candidatus Sumerlaeota bacterium]|nr:hypothetical protein [Candidatus Sumerlaeota bacterium]